MLSILIKSSMTTFLTENFKEFILRKNLFPNLRKILLFLKKNFRKKKTKKLSKN